MNKVIFLSLFLLGFLATSCVPIKDLIYLQKKENNLPVRAVNPAGAVPYRVQTNDVLSITIKTLDPKLAQLFNPTATENITIKSEQSLYFDGYNVDDHGNIRVPVLGEVNVIGFTLEEVRKKIEERLLSDYFNKEANLFVNVKLSGFRYTINGEISQPGTKTLYQEKVTVLDAIANSGDITLTGNRKDVIIIRQLPQGTEMYTIDLTDSKSLQSPHYYLQPNDYIYVKPLPQKSWGTGRTGVESLSLVVTLLSLVATMALLVKK